MSDAPAWLDEGPPPGADDYGSQGAGQGERRGGNQRGSGNRAAQDKMTPEQTAAAVESFYDWLQVRDTRASLQTVLPDHIDVDVFIATAKTAVLNKPELARADLRNSLLTAVMKAAQQGLLPDGKQGALVPRHNKEKGCQEVAWQPMVWGIVKLGRETGAIKSIRAVIVFLGENVEIDEVAGMIIHRRGSAEREIVGEAYQSLHGAIEKGRIKVMPDQFMKRVDMAYCVIEPAQGTPVMRWMPAERIALVRNSSPAVWGPWSSAFIDEMILKTVILFTAKWIDLDPSSAPAKRFQAALMQDMEIDFDRRPEEPEERARPALPAPNPVDKLSTLEGLFGSLRETVPAAGQAERHDTQQQAPAGTAGRTEPASSGESTDPARGDTPPHETGDAGADAPSSPAEVAHALLVSRVTKALGEFTTKTPAEVDRMARTKGYGQFIADLEAAGLSSEVDRLSRAVVSKRDLGLLIQEMAQCDSATDLMDWEKNTKIKERRDQLLPADRSDYAAAVRKRYMDMGAG